MSFYKILLSMTVALSVASTSATMASAINSNTNEVGAEVDSAGQVNPVQQPLVWFAIPVLLAWLGSEILTDQAAYAPTLDYLPCAGIGIPDLQEVEKLFPPVKEDGTFDEQKYQTACAVIKTWKKKVSKNPQLYPGVDACLIYQETLFICPIETQDNSINQPSAASI